MTSTWRKGTKNTLPQIPRRVYISFDSDFESG